MARREPRGLKVCVWLLYTILSLKEQQLIICRGRVSVRIHHRKLMNIWSFEGLLLNHLEDIPKQCAYQSARPRVQPVWDCTTPCITMPRSHLWTSAPYPRHPPPEAHLAHVVIRQEAGSPAGSPASCRTGSSRRSRRASHPTHRPSAPASPRSASPQTTAPQENHHRWSDHDEASSTP